MAENRITQAAVESVSTGNPAVRSTQLVVEALVNIAAVRTSQYVVEAIVRPASDFLGAAHGDRPFVY